MKKSGVLILLLSLFLAFGCPKGEQAQKAVESKAKPGSEESAEGTAGNKVLAKVGDFAITEEYVDKVIESLPEAFRAQYLLPGGKQNLVEYLVDMEALYQEAKSKKLDEDPGVAFKVEFAKKQLISAELLESELKAIPEPTDSEIESYYNENKDMFKRPEQARVRHILVTSNEEAKKVKSELEGGADFAQLAGEKSQDVSRVRGGELGWLDRGQTVQEFEQVIFTVPLNKPEIVQTQFGFHVLEVLERRDEGYRDLAEVRDEIINTLSGSKGQQKYKDLLQSLREKYGAQVFEEAFGAQE